MATRFLFRSLLTTTKRSLIPSFLRSPARASASFLRRLWPFTAAAANNNNSPQALSSDTDVPGFSTRRTSLPLNDPTPRWPIRLITKEEADLIDGCDFEHWIVVTVPPHNRNPTRDEVIDSYIKTLAKVVGSEEEARKKMYSVFTNQLGHAFGAHVSEELAEKLNELGNVKLVVPDFYVDVTNKKYGGEPFINGQAVPYDPKYYEEWVRRTRKGNVRNICNDQPLNFDRSRVYEIREIVIPPGAPDPPENHKYFPPQNAGMPRMYKYDHPNIGNTPPNCMSCSPNMLPNNFSRPNMGQPPSNYGGGVQPGNVPTFQHGNVPMNNGSA